MIVELLTVAAIAFGPDPHPSAKHGARIVPGVVLCDLRIEYVRGRWTFTPFNCRFKKGEKRGQTQYADGEDPPRAERSPMAQRL